MLCLQYEAIGYLITLGFEPVVLLPGLDNQVSGIISAWSAAGKRWEQDFSSWLSLPALDISPLVLPLPGLLLRFLLFGLLHILSLHLSFLFVTFPPTIIAYSYIHIHNIPIFKILSHRASLNLTVEQQSWIGSSPSFGGFVGIIYHILYICMIMILIWSPP